MAIRRGGGPNAKRVYRGDQAVRRVYRGDVLVWSAGAKWVQDFPRTANGFWSGFRTDTGLATQAREQSGGAGLVSLGMNSTGSSFQVFQGQTQTDDMYLDVTLRAPINGTLDTGSSGAPTYFRLRSNALWAVGTSVEIMLRASGGVSISSTDGASVVSRATASRGSSAMQAGDVIRMQAQGNVYTVLNLSRGTELVSWTDTGNVVTRSAAHRSSGMTQTANYPIFQRMYAGFSVSLWEFGDL